MKNYGQDFVEKTKYRNGEDTDEEKGLEQPPLEWPYDPDNYVIKLPDFLRLMTRPLNIGEAIEKRQSVRVYQNTPITMEELSYLLWCTQGVKKIAPGRYTIRNVPSAGARHPFETYLFINRVEGVKPGLYRYIATEHELMAIRMDEWLAHQLLEACYGQKFAVDGAVTFIWAAVPYRMTWRYGQRGYRYLYMEAGHVCQNLYLSAEVINCGICPIAAYDDDGMNAFLGIDGKEQFAIYIASLGKK